MNDLANTPRVDDAQSGFWAGPLFRSMVMRFIMSERDNPAEMKERVMLARQCGHLTDEAAEDLIVFWGLANA